MHCGETQLHRESPVTGCQPTAGPPCSIATGLRDLQRPNPCTVHTKADVLPSRAAAHGCWGTWASSGTPFLSQSGHGPEQQALVILLQLRGLACGRFECHGLCGAISSPLAFLTFSLVQAHHQLPVPGRDPRALGLITFGVERGEGIIGVGPINT